MTQPLPTETILPTGQRAYLNPYQGTYTTKRSYAMRMQRGYARGVPQSEARGKRANRLTGETESQRRRRLAIESGTTVEDQRRANWNARYPGMDYNWYRRIYRLYIQEINYRSSPDLHITPAVVYSQLANAQITGHDQVWVEERLAYKLYAMQQYQDEGNSAAGYQLYVDNSIDTNPPEWWYYH